MISSIAIGPEEHRARCDALPRARARCWALGSRTLRPVLRPLLRRVRVRPDRAADRSRPRRGGHACTRGPAARARACRGALDARSRRALPRVPGRPARRAGPRTDPHRPRPHRDDRRRPGRLSVDPRLSGTDPFRALGRERRPRHRGDRGADVGQVAGGGRAHPRERSLGEPRPPAAPAVPARRACRRRSHSVRATRRRSRCSTPSGRSKRERVFLGSTGAHAGYRGQIGRNSAPPARARRQPRVRARATSSSRARSAPVWGYLSELERTMVLGEPTPRAGADVRRTWSRFRTSRSTAIRPGPAGLGGGRRRAGVLRRARPRLALAPPHGAPHRPALPRRPVPRLGRSHGDPSGHGVHGRAGPLLTASSAAFATPTPSWSRTTEPRS